MQFIKYLWGNKSLTLLALTGIGIAGWVAVQNYRMPLMQVEEYREFQIFQATYCDQTCQDEITAGFLNQ
jgi:hypothetical protein